MAMNQELEKIKGKKRTEGKDKIRNDLRKRVKVLVKRRWVTAPGTEDRMREKKTHRYLKD